MIVQKIYLQQFRNFTEKLVELSPKMTVIVGQNATGKTNILESLYLLATGKSFKAKVEEEMIRETKEFARVKGLFKESESGSNSTIQESVIDRSNPDESAKHSNVKLEVLLTRGEITVGSAVKKEKVARKRLAVNGVGKRLIDFAGVFRVVLFGPWDLDLVTESPSVRRKFLDTTLGLVDREYRRASLSYEKGLRQRNRLLFMIREQNISRSQLIYWDHLLIKNGDYVSGKRQAFIEFLNSSPDFDGHDFSVRYDKNAISEGRLEQYKQEEVAAATTLVGPHRDDFVFYSKGHVSKNDHDLARFGSRGEQRMGVLWLKLSELSYIEHETESKPVLLLDDIFSELDEHHREIVMQAAEGQQTIITTADPHGIKETKDIEKIILEV